MILKKLFWIDYFGNRLINWPIMNILDEIQSSNSIQTIF